MKRFFCLMAMAAVLLFSGCQAAPSAVGCWATSDPDDYYFQLYDDGSCMMFDAADEWVSSGTYEAGEGYIAFETDTGSFVWSADPENEGVMLFDSGNTVFRYYLQE